MENTVKFCVVCGRKIPQMSLKRTICSDFCRRRKKCGYAPYLNYDKPPFEELTEIQQKAQKSGMSYGQYMSSLYNTKEVRKNAACNAVSIL